MNFRANSIKPYVAKSLRKPYKEFPAGSNRAKKGLLRPKQAMTDLASPGLGRAPLTPDQQTLAMRYIPMAKSLSKPLKLSWPHEGDEFESAAMLALVEAAQSYDPSRNVKFATFARFRIWGALRDFQRSLITAGWKGDLDNAPVVTSLPLDAEEHGRVLGAEPDAPTGADYEGQEYIESLLKKLPSRHAETVREIYVKGSSHGHAAEILGCSKSRLSYLHKEALHLINDAISYENRHDVVYPALESAFSF